MNDHPAKLILIICVVCLVCAGVWRQASREEQSDINKLWQAHRAIVYELDNIEAEYIQNEQIAVGNGYHLEPDLTGIQCRVREAVVIASRHKGKNWTRISNAIADSAMRVDECAKRVEALKTSCREQMSYATWQPALERIAESISQRQTLKPLPVSLTANKFLIWDFSMNAPTGRWDLAITKLPVQHRAKSLADNPIFLVIEQQRVETVGVYISTDGRTSQNAAPPSATIRHAQVSMFGDHGNEYLGTMTVSSGPPPGTLKTPAGSHTPGNLNFISDDAIANILLAYLPNGGKPPPKGHSQEN